MAGKNVAEAVRLQVHLEMFQNEVREQQALVGRGVGGREYALVQTKLDEARLWLHETRRVLLNEEADQAEA